VIYRHLTKALKDSAKEYPVVSVTGPRQSGKTTLVRATFPKYEYISLENPDHRAFALEDPRGFLGQWFTEAKHPLPARISPLSPGCAGANMQTQENN